MFNFKKKILNTDEFDKYGIVRVTIGVIMGVLRAYPKTNKIMTHFNLMRTQKHKILSIVVLNMAKYSIISLKLTDFVQIYFSYSTCFRILLEGPIWRVLGP